MTITLCFAPQTCARVPLIALEEVGLPFETRLIAFMAGEHRAPDYLALNPAGKVPALIVEDGVLSQNTAILTYLGRRFPEAKLLPSPASPLVEAQLIARLAWFSGDLHPLVTRIRMPQFACDVPDAIPRVREMASAALATQLAPVAHQLQQAPWLLGAEWSVLDAYLYWVWFRISGAGFDTGTFPEIDDHYRRMEARPAVRRALGRERAAEEHLAKRDLVVPLR